MNNPNDITAVCPFYETARENWIRCECRVSDARMYLEFTNKEVMKAYKAARCDGHEWRACPYADMLVSWWEVHHGKI